MRWPFTRSQPRSFVMPPDSIAAPAPCPLKDPPRWVEDMGYSSNLVAWQDTDDPIRLLGWIDDAGPTDDHRRAIGGVALAMAATRLRAGSRKDPVAKGVERIADFTRRWVEGAAVDYDVAFARFEEEARDAYREFSRSGKVARHWETDQPNEHGWKELHFADAWLQLAMAPLAFADPNAALAGAARAFPEALARTGGGTSDRWRTSLLSTIRARFPSPPAGYREPNPPRRWR
jgi:hypothetical protein